VRAIASSSRIALLPAVIQNSPERTSCSRTVAMASATRSHGTKSIGQEGSNGTIGTVPLSTAPATPCRPWNAEITPVRESPMTTEGRSTTVGTRLASTTCSAATLLAA
jgi:hypothetical protein